MQTQSEQPKPMKYSNQTIGIISAVVVAGTALILFAQSNDDLPPMIPYSQCCEEAKQQYDAAVVGLDGKEYEYLREKLEWYSQRMQYPTPLTNDETVELTRLLERWRTFDKGELTMNLEARAESLVSAAKPIIAIESPDKYKLPANAISSTDEIEHFDPPHSRFSKVPKYLVPIYEELARTHDIEVKYLAADGSYETHFRNFAIGGAGECGIHQILHPKSKGLSGEMCKNPWHNINWVSATWSKRAREYGYDPKFLLAAHNGGLGGYRNPGPQKYAQVIYDAANNYYQ